MGPLLMSSAVPSLIYGAICGEWGSNLVWGSLFGLGWCLGASWLGGSILLDDLSVIAGLLWGGLMLLPLFFGSGWLWKVSSERGRRIAVLLLAASFVLSVPARTMVALERTGLHLPDYSLHLATSY